MDRAQFWRLIGETRTAEGDSDDHALALTERLAALDPEEIVSFEHHFLWVLNELDCSTVCAVGALVFPLQSDDGFEDFRGWAILQGEQVVEDLLHAPERVGRHFPPDVCPWCENALSIANQAYERKTGNWELPLDPNAIPIHKDDPPLSDKEIQERFPDLWQRFMGKAN